VRGENIRGLDVQLLYRRWHNGAHRAHRAGEKSHGLQLHPRHVRHAPRRLVRLSDGLLYRCIDQAHPHQPAGLHSGGGGQGTTLTVAAPGLLANDGCNGIDAGPLKAVAAGPAATSQGGSYTVYADGSFSYTPPAGFVGTDGFTYSLKYGDNCCAARNEPMHEAADRAAALAVTITVGLQGTE
jgi:hypothetical protein